MNRHQEQFSRCYSARRLGWAGLASMLWLASGMACAEALTTPTTLVAPPPGVSDAAFELPPVVASSGGEAAPGRSQVGRIVFRGNRIIESAILDELVADYLERSLDATDIEALRQRITRFYVERGYVNSGALISAGALRDGVLTVDIVEGHVATLRLTGVERLHPDYIVKRLVPREDEALNVEQLRERFQRLLDDPLFERMNARLMPGKRLGEALLDVDVTRARPYFLSISANNYRPPSIDEAALNVAGGVRNLTGQGDLLEATLQQVKGGLGRGSLSWQMPLNQRGTRLSLQLDHGRSSIVEEPMRVLDIESTLDSKDLGLSQIVHESLRDRLTLGVNRLWRENHTRLLGMLFSFVPGEPDGVTRVRSWRFWQEYTRRSEQDAFALRSTFSWMRNNLQEAATFPVGSALPGRSYRTWLGQGHYIRQIHTSGTQLVLRGMLQTGNAHLLGLDQLAIGGVGTVRGYRENQMLRDTGAVLNAEIEQPVMRNDGAGLNLSLIPFYDIGHGRNRNEAGNSISSLGIALRSRWQGAYVDLAVAHRLVRPDAVDALNGSLQDKAVHLQVGYRLF
jgi:hemolysin activation/secretion protein